MTQPQGATSGAPDFEAATRWRTSQIEEYSQWVAAQDIYHGNALAYNAGDPVPATNVATYNYEVDGLVRRPDGWEDPVPGDGIDDDAKTPDEATAAAPQSAPTQVSDGAPENTAVKRTSGRKVTSDGNPGA